MNEFKSSVYLQNAASKHANWNSRKHVIAKAVLASDASFILFQELYKAQAKQMDSLISERFERGAYRNGRVIYFRRGRWQPVGSARWANMLAGKSKPAVGRKFKHVQNGSILNIVCVHLSFETDRVGAKKRETETQNILRWSKKQFPNDEIIFGGDWNSPAGSTTRKDVVEPIMRKAGYKDAGLSFGAKTGRGNYHLDRVFASGKTVSTFKLKIDRHGGSDHNGVFLKFNFKSR